MKLLAVVPAGTVLLLHGASGSSGDPMMALGERLAQRFRVVAVDRPGSGWSDRIGGAGAASPATQARIIRAALREIGIERDHNSFRFGHCSACHTHPCRYRRDFLNRSG